MSEKERSVKSAADSGLPEIWEGIELGRLQRALHRWKTEREGTPTPHTEWWADRCLDCADDAHAIIKAYIADAEHPEVPDLIKDATRSFINEYRDALDKLR